MDAIELKKQIIEAGEVAVQELILVAKEKIINPDAVTLDEDGDEQSYILAADRLKNAAAAKKIAIFDAFEILNRIEAERETLLNLSKGISNADSKQGFAERRSKQ